MSNTIIEKSVNELNQLILEGKAMEAFEKFYDDEVIMQENDLEPMAGKEENRKREKEFFNKAHGYENGKIEGVASGDNLTTVIWNLNYHHQDWGNRKYKQVSVQHWKNGKIIKEQFFYGL